MDDLAKALFEKDGNHPLEWAVVDECVRLHFRLRAEKMDRENRLEADTRDRV